MRKVALSKGKQPIISLFTDQQIIDMCRCRCGDDTLQCVLGIDLTYNLGPCYVTAVVYVNSAVTCTDSHTSPTLAGPMYLHWDASYDTYVDIFTSLRSTLDSNVSTTELRLSSDIVIGSNQERGMTRSFL